MKVGGKAWRARETEIKKEKRGKKRESRGQEEERHRGRESLNIEM